MPFHALIVATQFSWCEMEENQNGWDGFDPDPNWEENQAKEHDESSIPFMENPIEIYLSPRVSKTFNVLIVGEAGLGKSTFINEFFKKEILTKGIRKRTTEITISKAILESENCQLNLTLIDTPGYGDTDTIEKTANPVLAEIKARMDTYYKEITTTGLPADNLIHCCFFFIAPHRLKKADIKYLQLLAPYVNIVPIVAKGDSMTVAERLEYSQIVAEELKESNIEIYSFPGTLSSTDRAVINVDHVVPPFVVIGSDYMHPQYGPVREYSWGYACSENPAHCDLPLLRKCLLESQDFENLSICTKAKYSDYIVQRNSMWYMKHYEYLQKLMENDQTLPLLFAGFFVGTSLLIVLYIFAVLLL